MSIDISKLSVKQKIGQILMCGFEGKQIPPHMESLFSEYHIGGIIYFRRNVALPEQILQLSQSLQQLSSQYSDIPLSIAIDQEGGMVARIDQEVTIMPGQMTLGATGNSQFAYEAGEISGMELAQMGITVNFAPVLDVNNNPLNPVIGIRSFGEHPETVAQFGVEMINGYQEMGISACAKHFPGHGDTSADSHHELPAVAHDLERIHAVELVPFKAAIEAGVDMIMTAHVQFPAIEPNGDPATISYSVLTELLRNELGYKGVIVTDCLEMKAISEGIGVGRGAVEAVKAGADLILVSHRFDRQIAAFKAIEEAIESGEITEERLNEAVDRVLAVKAKQQDAAKRSMQNWRPIGDERSWQACGRMMQAAVTLVQDDQQHLPLNSNSNTLVIWPEVRVSSEVDEVIPQELTLGKELAKYGLPIHEVVIGVDPTQDEIMLIRQKVADRQYRQIVMAMYNAAFSEGQQVLIQDLQAEKEIAIVFVSVRNPYDYALLTEQDTYVSAYENRTAMLKALASALTGTTPFSGQLPVSL